MSNDNQAVENKEAVSETEAEQIAAAKSKIPFFDEMASVVDEGGEIDLLINALYEACMAKNIPFVGAAVHSIVDEGDGFSLGLRGIQVTGENGFVPAGLVAMNICMESKEISELVVNIANDPKKMAMLQMMATFG